MMRARLVRLRDIATITQGMGRSGRAAGARAGDWRVSVVGVGDIQDDRLRLERAEVIAIRQNIKTEKHLLLPDDLLLTARSNAFKAALVPPWVDRTVADASLNVVRACQVGLGAFLWWYVTSSQGRQQMQELMVGATVLALPAGGLADALVPLPEERTLDLIAELVDASEQAYAAATEAALVRRAVVRDGIIAGLRREAEETHARH